MKPISESSTQEVLADLVERVTFHNAENGFCVLRAKARGHRDLVTVVGHAAIISAGMDHCIRRMDQRSRPRSAVQGAVSQDLGAEFDRRDREISRLRNDPGHRAGLRQEVAQGLWREGLRRHRGRARSPSRRDGHRRGSGQADHGAWAEQKIVQEIMVFLHSNRVGTAWAVRIFKTHGADPVRVIFRAYSTWPAPLTPSASFSFAANSDVFTAEVCVIGRGSLRRGPSSCHCCVIVETPRAPTTRQREPPSVHGSTLQ